MKKIAIIIKSEANDLPGVVHDVENFKNFLRDPYGGEWHDGEIYTISTPSHFRYSNKYLISALDNIKNGRYDYAIVLYSGHGGLNDDEQLIIYPDSGTDIPAAVLCNLAPKQLTIFDCCRSFDEEAKMVKEAVNASSSICPSTRSFYEQLLHHAHPQQNILFACDMGEYAQDTSKGALYFNALLMAAKTYTSYSRWKTVRETHELAAEYVRLKSFNQQHPDYLIPKIPREHSLPFSINPWSRLA